MQALFLELLKLSLIGSLFAIAVMLLRLLFGKAPRWIFCVLWGIVALRLILPISVESDLSLVPDRLATGQIISNVGNDYIGDVTILHENDLSYSNALDAGRQPIYSDDGYYVVTQKNSLEAPQTIADTIYPLLSWLWLAGLVLMLGYTALSYLLLKRKMAEATLLRDHIWQCEQVESPFVLGIIRPRIYLPYQITDSDMENVIAHEQAHIRRKDHWWKPLGFLLLSVHWFNPILWIAYILLCRDIEAACDEKVIANMEKEEMQAYSTSLLNCSIHRRRIAACPLAFGEVGVKERIKHVMYYKKPAFWIIASTICVGCFLAVCFLTSPATSREFEMSGYHVSDLDVDRIIDQIEAVERVKNGSIYTNSDNFTLTIDDNFHWVHSQTMRYFFYRGQETRSAQLRIFPDEAKFNITESSEWVEQSQGFLLRLYLEAIKYLPQAEIRRMAPADQYLIRLVGEGSPSLYSRVITYSAEGAGETDGWFIHLRVEPLHKDGEGYSGTGDEVIDLFYGVLSNEAKSNVVKLTDVNNDAGESSYWVRAYLPGTDFSSIGQTLQDKLRLEWSTYDGLSEMDRLLSSHLWGAVDFQTDTWEECEAYIGLKVPNPLESVDWIKKTDYFGAESTNDMYEVRHIRISAYAPPASDRTLNSINITAGYNKDGIRITLNAAMQRQSSMHTTGGIDQGYKTFTGENTVTGSGIPVLIVTGKPLNDRGEVTGQSCELIAYWVQDNVFYTLRMHHAEYIELQNALRQLLAEI